MPKSIKPSPNGFHVGIAASIADLLRLDDLMRGCLLDGKLDRSGRWIKVEADKVDGGAVEFTCDPLTAACVLDTIRSHDQKIGQYRTRVWVRYNIAWTKVPSSALLSVVEGESVKLNPDVFPSELRPVAPVPPKTEALT